MPGRDRILTLLIRAVLVVGIALLAGFGGATHARAAGGNASQTPRIHVASTGRIGDWIEIDLSGFQPNMDYTESDSFGNSWRGYTTDAKGSDVMSIKYFPGDPTGPRSLCVTQADGTSACQSFDLLPALSSQADPVSLLLAMAVSIGLAVAVHLASRGYVLRLPSQDVGRKARFILAYIVGAIALVFAPFGVFALAATVRALVNTSFRNRIRLIRSNKPWRVRLGWILWAVTLLLALGWSILFLIAAVTDPNGPGTTNARILIIANALFVAPMAVIGLYVAVWQLTGVPTPKDRASMVSRVLDYLALMLIPPVGITRLKLRRADDAGPKSWWVVSVLSWIVIYAALAMSVTYETVYAGDIEWSDWLSMLIGYVIVGVSLAFPLWIARRGYARALAAIQQEPDHDAAQTGRLRSSPLNQLLRQIAVPAFALLAVVGLAAAPWIQLDLLDFQRRTSDVSAQWLTQIAAFINNLFSASNVNRPLEVSTTQILAIGRIVGLLLAAIPVLVVSWRILVAVVVSRSAKTEPTRAIPVLPALVGTFITAITIVLVGALLQDSTVQIGSAYGSLLTVFITGVGVGLSAGLSVGMGRQLNIDSQGVVAAACTGFSLLLLALIAATGQDSGAHSLLPPTVWFSVPATGISALCIGFVVGDRLLIPGLMAFSGTAPYLKELSLPLIGFILGYVFVVLGFGGLYFAVDRTDCSNFSVQQVSQASTSQNGCSLSFDDLVFYSVNTIAPLGDSDVRPASPAMRIAATVELAVGIGFTLVVFGAVLAGLNDSHVTKIVSEQIAKRRSTSTAVRRVGGLPDIAARLSARTLDVGEQWALVHALEEAVAKPLERDAADALIRKFQLRSDLYHWPAEELRRVRAIADDRSRDVSARQESSGLVGIAIASLVVATITEIAFVSPSSRPAHPAVVFVDQCVVGNWTLKEADTFDERDSVDFTGAAGATLDVSPDGTAVYSFGPQQLPFVARLSDGQLIALQLNGTVAVTVKAVSSEAASYRSGGTWTQSELWASSYNFTWSRPNQAAITREMVPLNDVYSDLFTPTIYTCGQHSMKLIGPTLTADFARS